MMEQTKIYTALKGVRGRKPVDLAGLEQLLVRFSQLITEQRGSRKSTSTRCWLRPRSSSPSTPAWCSSPRTPPRTSCRKPAIRPYPTQYVIGLKLQTARGMTHSADPSRG